MRRLTVLVLASLSAACTIMTGLHLPKGEASIDEPPADGDAGRLADGAVARDDSGKALVCNPLKPPGPPATSAGGAGKTVTVALKDFDSRIDTKLRGFDLDNLCTCSAARGGGACKNAGTSTNEHCDQDDGIDNASSDVFKLITAQFNFLNNATLQIGGGEFGRVVEITSYNGMPNDDAVTVTVFASPGIGEAPNFGTVQRWPVGASVSSKKAWVNGNVVVAEFEAFEIPFLALTSPPIARLQHAIFTGTLTPDGTGAPTLATATLQGRAEVNELIRSVGEILVPTLDGEDMVPLCFVPQFTGTGSGVVCDAPDLPVDPADDAKGTATCAAMSMKLVLDFAPAEKGDPVTISPTEERCGTSQIKCK